MFVCLFQELEGVDQSYSEIKGHWPESGAQHTKLFACIALIQAAIRRALDHMGNGGAPPRWEREFKGANSCFIPEAVSSSQTNIKHSLYLPESREHLWLFLPEKSGYSCLPRGMTLCSLCKKDEQRGRIYSEATKTCLTGMAESHKRS
ncbi:hypothetical protein F2P79_004592 [Pimephales promelas]|nr:hypothetical protein F2P79_004592 [Pimephales promelas]